MGLGGVAVPQKTPGEQAAHIASAARVLVNHCNGRVRWKLVEVADGAPPKNGLIPAGSRLQARAESPLAEASLQENTCEYPCAVLPGRLGPVECFIQPGQPLLGLFIRQCIATPQLAVTVRGVFRRPLDAQWQPEFDLLRHGLPARWYEQENGKLATKAIDRVELRGPAQTPCGASENVIIATWPWLSLIG